MTGAKNGSKTRGGSVLRELLIGGLTVVVIVVWAETELHGGHAALGGALCQSNARQVGIALFMYAADYDGKLPAKAGNFTGLIASTRPYLRDDSRYHCPVPGLSARNRPVGFRVPLLYQGLPVAGGWPDPYLARRIAEPDATVLLFETDTDEGAEIAPVYRHSGGAVCLTLSGQAMWAQNLRQAK